MATVNATIDFAGEGAVTFTGTHHPAGAEGPPISAPISVAVEGDTTIVSAIPGKRIVVIGLVLAADGATVVRLKSGEDALTGEVGLTATVSLRLPTGMAGWVRTAVGEALVLELDAANAVTGMVAYRLA